MKIDTKLRRRFDFQDFSKRYYINGKERGVIMCDLLSMLVLNSFGQTLEEREAAGWYWLERARVEFPNAILVVELEQYRPNQTYELEEDIPW